MSDRYRKRMTVAIATDVGHEFRPLLDTAVIALIICGLIGLGLQNFNLQVSRAMLSEGLVLVSTSKTDMVTYRAQFGHWPESKDGSGNGTLIDQERIGRYTSNLALRPGGAIDIELHSDDVSAPLSGRILTVRLAVARTASAATVTLGCGSFAAPPGLHYESADRTNIDLHQLPYLCKGPE